MSLINQMLNDLEKRGESMPLPESSIRAVPVQIKSPGWLYVTAGIVLPGMVAALWWQLHRPTTVLPPVIALAIPAHPAAVSQVAAVSQPPAEVHAVIGEQTDRQVSGVEAQSSVVLAPVSSPSGLSDISSHERVVPMQNTSPVALNKAPAAIEPTGSVSKQLKKASPQQQAENEFRKANLLAQQGLPGEAATGYKTALHIDPAHVLAREALVAVLLQRNLNTEAENTLQEGLQQNPKQTHFAMLLARLQVERNALPLALNTLEKTLPYAGQQADYQAFVAALMQRQNRHTEAIAYYHAALQMSPNSGLWLMGLGISLQAAQRKQEARDAYKRAIEVRTLSPELQAFVGQRLKEIE